MKSIVILISTLILFTCSTAVKKEATNNSDIIFNDRCEIVNKEEVKKAGYKVTLISINPYTDNNGAVIGIITNKHRYFLGLSPELYALGEEMFVEIMNNILKSLETKDKQVIKVIAYRPKCLVFEVIMGPRQEKKEGEYVKKDTKISVPKNL